MGEGDQFATDANELIRIGERMHFVTFLSVFSCLCESVGAGRVIVGGGAGGPVGDEGQFICLG